MIYIGQTTSWCTRKLFELLQRQVVERRPPDVLIGGEADPYMRRWWIIPRNRWFNVYLHHFLRSDDDRALHDHPWVNASILLQGSYIEHRPGGDWKFRRPGAVYFRWANSAHRVELMLRRDLNRGPLCDVEVPVWTLFITGPKVCEWGFLCPKGWRHWRDFTNARDGGLTTGKGCADE